MDATNLYWFDGSALMACAKDACKPKVLASSLPGPYGGAGLAVQGTELYFVAGQNQEAVYECATDGCTEAGIVASLSTAPLAITADATGVYMITENENGVSVMRCAPGGCATWIPTVLASSQGSVPPAPGIAVDGTNVYWTVQATAPGEPGDLLACAVGGCNGQPTTLASGQAAPGVIAVDGTSVYWGTAHAIVKLTPK